MSRDKQIEEMTRDIGEKQKGGWKFVGESEYTTDTTNEELAEHLVINKGYRKSTDVAEEIFAEIDELLLQNATMQIATSTLHCKLAELKKKYAEGGDG